MSIEKEFDRLGLGRKPEQPLPESVKPIGARTMQYKIIQSTDPQEVADKVGENLAKGWRPQGGIAITCPFPGAVPLYKYAQALVKD
jgi:hypothetical protein